MRLCRRDANHADVVKAFRSLGVPFIDVSHLEGLGCDLIARHLTWGTAVLIELKDGRLPPSRRKLTESEKVMEAAFPESFVIALSVKDALAAVGLTAIPLANDRLRKME